MGRQHRHIVLSAVALLAICPAVIAGLGHGDSDAFTFDAQAVNPSFADSAAFALNAQHVDPTVVETGEFNVDLSTPGRTWADSDILAIDDSEPQLYALCIGVDNAWPASGAEDARAIWATLRQFDGWAEHNPPPLILDPNIGGESNLADVRDAVGRLAARVRPGDGLIFYFCGHGSFLEDIDEGETPVWIPFIEMDNRSDEYLLVTDRSVVHHVSDDLLLSEDWFGNDTWAEVDKVFLLDACHSGGFMGDHNPDDDGDLEKLPRTAVLAAAPEWGPAFAVDGRGLWSLRLELRLWTMRTIDDLAGSMVDWDWSEYVGQELPLLSGFFPPEGTTATFVWEPYYAATDDFDFDAVMAGMSLADTNCDGSRNAFDIDPFVLALTDPTGYAGLFPRCNIMNADCNADGALNAFDVDPFVELLISGGD